MWIGMIIFWGLLICAVYALVTAAASKSRRHDSYSARDILDNRLARGDIDEAEYQRLRDLIGPGDQRDSASAGNAR